MIEQQEVDGRPATVAYMREFKLVAKADATAIKVVFDDDGSTLWLSPPQKKDERKKQWQATRAEAQRLLARSTGEDYIKDPKTGLMQGSRPEGGSEKPTGGGKSKKKATKDDFKKAKIILNVNNEEAFVDKWNDKIGEDPAAFKAEFMGGLDGTMTLGSAGDIIDIKGNILAADGGLAGTFTRSIDLEDKVAKSAYFTLAKSQQKSDIGKKLLAGNIETYERLGIEKVNVTANIDVGGYAWAKYGYVPTQSAWNALRDKLEDKLTGRGDRPSSYGRERGPNEVEADDWNMLSSDVQDNVRDQWMRETHDEFLQSEEDHWRNGGQALDDAKVTLADDDQFVLDAINEHLAPEDVDPDDPKQKEPTKFPYTAGQLAAAINIEYDSDGEGRGDVTVDFNDDALREPIGHEGGKDQMTLPGIEPEDLSERLTKEMRQELEEMLIEKFEDKASDLQYRMDAPDYLADGVTDYQAEHWDQLEDRDKLHYAIQYDMAVIEIEPEEEEEEEEEPEAELALEPPKDPLLELVRSSDPKSIWKIADSPRGKELLLGKNWYGVLDLKDKELMARFKAYVGRKKAA